MNTYVIPVNKNFEIEHRICSSIMKALQNMSKKELCTLLWIGDDHLKYVHGYYFVSIEKKSPTK